MLAQELGTNFGEESDPNTATGITLGVIDCLHYGYIFFLLTELHCF